MTDHPDAAGEETLREFKDSFFYGSRSNLDFKFLADLPPEEAGDFLAGILRELSSTIGLADRRTLEAFVAKASLATT